MARKANQQPATAYDYRRVIALVQTLAIEGSDNPIRQLCDKWDIEPVWDYSATYWKSRLDVWATVRKLAQHALEYTREN